MAPKEKKSQTPWPPPIPFGKKNLTLYVAGLAVLIIGYILLSIGPWENPLSRSAAPLVLLIGYLVLFPLAIMIKPKKESEGKPE